MPAIKKIVLFLFVLIATCCKHLDKQTSGTINNILENPEGFKFYTYESSCILDNIAILAKTSENELIFITAIDSTIIIKDKYSDEKKEKIKQLLLKGYNSNEPHDTGPGNGNRNYWLQSKDYELHFFNNNQDIYEMFLEINGVRFSYIDSLESLALKALSSSDKKNSIQTN